MKYTKSDLVNAENLIKCIKRARYDFTGMESLAFSEACRWFNGIVEEIQQQVQPHPLPMAAKEVKPAVKEIPKNKPAKSKSKK